MYVNSLAIAEGPRDSSTPPRQILPPPHRIAPAGDKPPNRPLSNRFVHVVIKTGWLGCLMVTHNYWK